jgi:hypothetical protein
METSGRPGDTVARPCHNGARPGDTVGGPRHNGTRPGDTVGRPCLNGARPGDTVKRPCHNGGRPGDTVKRPRHNSAWPGDTVGGPRHKGGAPSSEQRRVAGAKSSRPGGMASASILGNAVCSCMRTARRCRGQIPRRSTGARRLCPGHEDFAPATQFIPSLIPLRRATERIRGNLAERATDPIAVDKTKPLFCFSDENCSFIETYVNHQTESPSGFQATQFSPWPMPLPAGDIANSGLLTERASDPIALDRTKPLFRFSDENYSFIDTYVNHQTESPSGFQATQFSPLACAASGGRRREIGALGRACKSTRSLSTERSHFFVSRMKSIDLSRLTSATKRGHRADPTRSRRRSLTTCHSISLF